MYYLNFFYPPSDTEKEKNLLTEIWNYFALTKKDDVTKDYNKIFSQLNFD